MTLAIEEHDHLNHSPGFALVAQGWTENVLASRGSHELTLGWDQKTIIAREGDEVVGVIVWMEVAHLRDAFIVLGYVHPSYRCRGIYSALYRRLVQLARHKGLRSVSGGVAYDNEVMRAVAIRQGRKPVAVTYAQTL